MYVSFSSGSRRRPAGDRGDWPNSGADAVARRGRPGHRRGPSEAVEALTREAEEYGADAVVDVRFEIDGCKGCDIEGVRLQRVTATGLAVRFARAA